MQNIMKCRRYQLAVSILTCGLVALGGQPAAAEAPTVTGPSGAELASAAPFAALPVVEREVLADDVVHYSTEIPVGPGPYDRIGLHRVVRERAPHRPIRTDDAVFMVHGDIWGFEEAFLADGARSLPVFLAAGDVDVWGIDLRWTGVPAETTDLSFLADWSMATDIRDLDIALATARLTRALTGSGGGPLTLLGWSRGGQLGYGYLSQETQRPAFLRQVDGFVPVDIMVKTDDPALRAAACVRAADTAAQIAAGAVANTSGQLIATLGLLAQAAPTDPSPVLPWLTNREAGLFVGAATFGFFPEGLSVVPFYHFTGGVLTFPDGLPVPVELLYTDEELFLSFLPGAAPYQPNREILEGDQLICDDPTVAELPYDDHLGEISVPVLYVGAAGGFGEYGVHTTTLLASSDVTVHVPRLLTPTERLVDLGHADIFLADDAVSLYWQPILDWVASH